MKYSGGFLVLSAASLLCAAAAGAGACSTSGFTLPAGAQRVTAPFGTCSVTDGYALTRAAYCLGVTCSGGTYFALCDGTDYVACDCSVPGGDYVAIANPTFGSIPTGVDSGTSRDASSDSTSGGDAGEDSTSSGDANADSTAGGDASEDSAAKGDASTDSATGG